MKVENTYLKLRMVPTFKVFAIFPPGQIYQANMCCENNPGIDVLSSLDGDRIFLADNNIVKNEDIPAGATVYKQDEMFDFPLRV